MPRTTAQIVEEMSQQLAAPHLSAVALANILATGITAIIHRAQELEQREYLRHLPEPLDTTSIDNPLDSLDALPSYPPPAPYGTCSEE